MRVQEFLNDYYKVAHFTCTFWLPQLSIQTKNMIIVVSNWNWIIDSCHKLTHVQPWYEVLGEVSLDLVIYFLHVQMSTLKWPKFWDYQSPFLKLKHFDFEGGLNIWHQYFMDLNENFQGHVMIGHGLFSPITF
jgi:hypothetical protein